jgi:hypothetical protein
LSKKYLQAYVTVSSDWFDFITKASLHCNWAYCPEHWCCQISSTMKSEKASLKAVAELTVPRHSVQWSLWLYLHMYPCRISVLHKLYTCDLQQTVYFAVVDWTWRIHTAQHLIFRWGIFSTWTA